jgi:hypothetical protein
MRYSINLYLKNKKKFETINTLISEIEEINSEKQSVGKALEEMRDKMVRDLAGKTIKTGVTYNSRGIVIGKRGFGMQFSYSDNSYSDKARFNDIDEKFLTFLRTHKLEFNMIKGRIKREDKKEILSIFVRNAQNEKDNYELDMKVGKNIIDPDDMKPTHIVKIIAKIGDSRDLDMRAYKKDGGSLSLSDDDSIYENMIKEQLYLPIWKLLIKAKRHALKQKRIAEKRFAKMKKELEPFWVADKLAEVGE